MARSIAAIVGATDKKEGYIEGNGYAVTWAFGHLVTLAMPDAYGIKGFQRDNCTDPASGVSDYPSSSEE